MEIIYIVYLFDIFRIPNFRKKENLFKRKTKGGSPSALLAQSVERRAYVATAKGSIPLRSNFFLFFQTKCINSVNNRIAAENYFEFSSGGLPNL